jgi:glycosyltransferase involved in cell wall biosynthesis
MFLQQGIDTRKITIIHNPGPDPSQFHPGVKGDSIRLEYGINQDTFLITLVGAFHEWKGHEVLLRAAPQVLASFPNTRFMLVGGEINGAGHAEYARRLKALPGELGIQDKVIFTGYRNDIPQIMAASDVVPFCSIVPDPFPGVVLQGMAVGKPVVASNLGGPKEQIEDGISGLLVEPGNSTALADSLCYLLQNEAERKRLGEAAVEQVRSTFSSEIFFQKLSSLYNNVISGT